MLSAMECLLGVLFSWIAYEYYVFASLRNKLKDVPTIGSDTFLLSYISAWKFMFRAQAMLEEGYKKYPDGLFKVATLETGSRWYVIASGERLLKEIKHAKDDELSIKGFADELMQVQYTFGKYASFDSKWHTDAVRVGVTRNLGMRYADIIDEVRLSFEHHMRPTEEWTNYPVLKTLLPIVTRTTNRLLVNTPLSEQLEGHNPAFLEIQEKSAVAVMAAAWVVNLCPSFLKHPAGRMLSYVPWTINNLRPFVEQTLTERILMEKELGSKYEGRPNDLISWLLDYAPTKTWDITDLILRILIINFAAIHTTSMTLANAIFDLAERPEYLTPLREEVQEVTRAHGWTKDSISKMYKLDSFLRESARWNPVLRVANVRTVAKDLVYDGVLIPKGITMAAYVGNSATQTDSTVSNDTSAFKGFRFSDGLEGKETDLKNQMTSPAEDFLLFGIGKHACPGRFFAVNELKSMMAHILMNYDLKLPDKMNPGPLQIGTQRIPGSGAVSFRIRRESVSEKDI